MTLSPPLEYDHDTEGHALPITAIQDALDLMEYASVERVMFEMLVYTGCRIQELNLMKPRHLYGDTLYWPCGKNQSGWRKEKLPIGYVLELNEYRQTHRVPESMLFGVSAETFRTYFKQRVRPRLGPSWQRQRLVPTKHGLKPEYVFQLKGTRKTFQTLKYHECLQEWGSPMVAAEMTGKQMRYATARVSLTHYVENLNSLGLNKGAICTDPARMLSATHQRRLLEY